ncbi:MAG: extracellular solute-binding protein [Clostridia bacterium]|nr:extracellular solute-binding protein [Clostridia bacterium]
MNINKRAMSVLLCAACLGLTACGDKTSETTKSVDIIADENVSAPGELPVVKKPIELTIGVMGSPKIENYETNAFTKFLEEKTGIKIKFYQFPGSGGAEKLNVMLSSGTELPEVICGFQISKADFLRYAPEGTFVDLAPYMEKESFWFNDVKKNTKIEYLDGWLSTANGAKYFMPHIIEQDGNVYGGKAFINKNWLDKLNLPMPETIEDFKNVMTAFKTMDPNGNGKADEIAFTGSTGGWNEKPINFLMNSYIYDDYNDGFVVDDQGKISLNYVSDDYKQGLKEISEMVKDGIVDVQCLTQTNDTLRALCSADEELVGAFASGSPDSLFPSGDERLIHYVALPPLKGPNGKAFALKSDYNVACSGVITKYCKHPLAAYRLLDFMMSEEASLMTRYGVKGQDWEEAKEGDIAAFGDLGYEAKIISHVAYGAVQNSNWHQLNPAFRSSAQSDTIAWDGDPLDGEYFKAKALGAYWGKGPEEVFSTQKMLLDLEEQEEFDRTNAEIKQYVKEQIALFVTGKKDIDTDWDTFQAELSNLSVERYVELAQKGYEAFKATVK